MADDDPFELIEMVRKIDNKTCAEALSTLHLREDRRQKVEAYVREIRGNDPRNA